jgi:hypothetical protein
VSQWVERNQNIRNVVLVSIWRQPIEGNLQGPDGRYLEGDTAREVFQQQFARTLRRFHDNGKGIYVWEPIPTAKKSVPMTLARNLGLGLHLHIETSREEHEHAFSFMKSALDANRDLLRGSISPVSTMCSSGLCMIERDGAPLFFDNNHPALSQAPFYAKIIEEQLKGLD